MFFYTRDNFICAFCGEKKSDGTHFRNHCGICTECNERVGKTPRGGTFSGREYIKYIISALFYEGLTRDAIMRYKFEGWSGIAAVFEYIMREHISGFTHLNDFDAVIPVPLSKERYNERGFNQSLPLAQAVAKTVGIKCDEKSFVKIRNTRRQSRLTLNERIMNVHGAYRADSTVRGKRIILVDDIYTTGATLNECARTLAEAGTKDIIGVTLAIKYKKEKSPAFRY